MFSATYANEKLRRATHLGGWSFRGKETVPLQSADLMAYECFKLIENHVVNEGEKRPVRILMTKLVGAEKFPYLRFFDKLGLEKFVTERESRVSAEKLSYVICDCLCTVFFTHPHSKKARAVLGGLGITGA